LLPITITAIIIVTIIVGLIKFHTTYKKSNWKNAEKNQHSTLPPSYVDCLEIWEPQPPGNLKSSTGIVLPFASQVYLVGI
jgi:hypothetical protein